MSFRIISVKPLEGCDRGYRKILKENIEYELYSDWRTSKGASPLPVKFYVAGEIPVSISAIVGKNGCGKSSVIEIFIRVINNFYYEYGKEEIKDVNHIKNLYAEVIFQTDRYFKIVTTKDGTDLYRLDQNQWVLLNRAQVLELDFFYSIVINYSHYAYNEKDFEAEGGWLTKLFHKNDGYQTPIVLNPYRENGNIDINIESDLLRQRLLSNLTQPYSTPNRSLRHIKKGLEAKYIQLGININKTDRTLYNLLKFSEQADSESKGATEEAPVHFKDLQIDKDILFDKLESFLSINFKNLEKKYQLVLDYIIYKLVSICVNYKDFEIFFDKEKKKFREEDLDTYLHELIVKDRSHIGFKLKQAFNFLKFKHFDLIAKSYDIDSFSSIIEGILKNNPELKRIEILPPPIFKIDIQLVSTDIESNKKEKVYFSQLSSGEKQRIFSISSLTYHLLNLDSVSRTANRIPYKYVNIILEEIELYFHPEMQRLLIDDILEAISTLRLNNIKAVNFCFITHSPFILSDIPSENILFLNEDGTKHQKPIENTFGSNIHDLLSDSFFLEKGLIGEFAKKKIEWAIKSLQPSRKKIKNTNINKIEILSVIDLIGEPFIREKLLELFYAKFPDDKAKQIELLRNQINRLEQQ